jgi:hypothetical protein
MSDLKSPWTNPPVPDVGTSGEGVTQRGSDPNITVDTPNGLQPVWGTPPVTDPSGQETANSVSGLPLRPARNEPTGTPPEPPSLQDRTPGTIDQK